MVQGDLPRHWEFKFHWQTFFSKVVWQRRTEEYISAVASSDLPEVIKDIEAERFNARLDSFARRIHNVTPWEPRLKLSEQDFLDSRSFSPEFPWSHRTKCVMDSAPTFQLRLSAALSYCLRSVLRAPF